MNLHFMTLKSANNADIAGSALMSASRFPCIYSTHRIASEMNPILTIATDINEISTAYIVFSPRSLPAVRHIRLTRRINWPYFIKLKYKSQLGSIIYVKRTCKQAPVS